MNKLYVFMGYPGCGKSTFAKSVAIHPTDLYLSSDELREELYGFRDQSHNEEVFKELHRRAIDHAPIGDTYIDATNLTRKDRMKTINQFKKLYSPHLICILRPIDELVEVNNKRQGEEHIPDAIFKNILGRFQLPTYEEGWDNIAFKIISDKPSMENIIFNYDKMEDKPHDNPHHPETIKEHINLCISYCKENYLSPYLLNMSYYHDLGKFYVQQYNEEKGYSQTIGHAAVSAYIYLIDTSIRYLILYNKQQGLSSEALNRLFNIYKMTDCFEILTMYYLIFYHDQPYACPDKDLLLKSLNKQSKPLYGLQKEGIMDIEFLADLLIGFNRIDRMRDDGVQK